MNPVETERSNGVYKGPTPEIGDLPCEIQGLGNGLQRVVYSVWEPSELERELLARGENIKLGIWTSAAIPPVSLEVVAEQGIEKGGV